MDKTLLLYLEENGIKYSEYEHPAVFTVAESKEVTSHIPGLRTKSLFLSDRRGSFYLVCLPSHDRLNIKALQGFLHVKNLEFGSPEELYSELNVRPGSVSPLAIIHAKKTSLIISKKVWSAELIGAHPNINTSTITLKHEEFARFCNSLKTKPLILDCE